MPGGRRELQRLRSACGGDVDWRMGLLDGRGHQVGLVQLDILAIIGESTCTPESFANVYTSLETLLALAMIDVISPKLVTRSASSEADINPSTAKYV